MKKKVMVATGICIIPAAWYLVSLAAGSFAVPAPWVTVMDTVSLLNSFDAWKTILITIGRVFIGFSAALALGTVVGVAMGKKSIEYLLRPTILLMQGVPPILWSIPLILILGFSRLAPIAIITLICFPLTATNISEGMRTIPQELSEMLHIYAPGRMATLCELIFPHLKPFFAASVRLGLGLGIKASVLAEYFAANDGIGFQIQTAYQAFMIRKLFSWALVLVLLILMFDWAVRRLTLLMTYRSVSSTVPTSNAVLESALPQQFETRDLHGELDLTGVSFGYEKKPLLFEGVDLRVGPKEIAVISGDSGTGKTSLLKVISRLLPPITGRVSSPELMGFMFQDDRFLPWFDNLRNLSLPLRYQGYTRQESEVFARMLMKLVGLVNQERAYPHELSGGMIKRLAFARSFSCVPDALLLDEPFTGLHHDARAELWARFSTLLAIRPVPVIVVTHFPEEVPAGPGTRFFTLSGNPARIIPA